MTRANSRAAASKPRALRRRLAQYDLAAPGRERPWLPVADTPFSTRLRRALEELGPVAAAFGRYLATRVDLLPPQDRDQLARTGMAPRPAPVAAVHRLLRSKLGRAADELAALQPTPRRYTWLHQWHDVVLPDGKEATVKVVRPDLEARLAGEATALNVLTEVAVPPWQGGALPLDDFRAAISKQSDLRSEADALEHLAAALAGYDLPAVPKVFGTLSAREIITTSRLDQSPGVWGDLAASMPPAPAEEGDVPRPTATRAADAAYRVALTWLLVSLVGEYVACGPLAGSLEVLADGRVAITGGPFEDLGDEPRWNLLDYLAATRRHDVDRACDLLLRETTASNAARTREQLRFDFRQAMPMREGDWSGPDTGRRLADYVFLQARLASRGGYRPEPHLVAFLRGLAEVDALARQLAPDRDPLREALNDARWIATAVRVRESIDPVRFADPVRSAFSRLGTVLERIDELVTNGTSPEREVEKDDDRDRDSWVVFGGYLGLLVAVALVAGRLSSVAAGVPVETVGAIVFAVLLVALLVRVLRED